MAEQGRRPGPSRRDKGKSKVGEPIPDDDDDIQTQTNEPGPLPRDDSIPSLGPLMKFCLRKTLTPREANPINPILYLDAYEAAKLIDIPDIVSSPSVSFSKKFRVQDVDDRKYEMLLSHCALGAWIGYSITADWEKFVTSHNLGAGDTVLFYRSLDRDVIGDYYYALMLEQRKDNAKQRERPSESELPIETAALSRSRDANMIANRKWSLRFSKTLSSDEVDPLTPVLYLDVIDAYSLTGRREMFESPSAPYSQNMRVFDKLIRRYNMRLSNSVNGYTLTEDWGEIVRIHMLEAGDKILFYRSADRDVSGDYHYAVKYERSKDNAKQQKKSSKSEQPIENAPWSSSRDDDMEDDEEKVVLCFTKTLNSDEVNLTNPVLYLVGREAFSLTGLREMLEPPSLSCSINILVTDRLHRRYNMKLSNRVDGYSLTEEWGEIVRIHMLRAGDEVSFYIYYDNRSGRFCYFLSYVKYASSDDEEENVPWDGKNYTVTYDIPRVPNVKHKGPGSRKLSVDDICLSMDLTASDVAELHPVLHLSVDHAFLFTDCDEVNDDPPDIFSEDFLVFDEFNRRYTMNVSNPDRGSPKNFVLNTGWNRFVRTYDLKVDDEILFFRYLNRDSEKYYYVIRYIRKPRDKKRPINDDDALENTPSQKQKDSQGSGSRNVDP